MSAKVTGLVFERYPVGGGEMLLALALADHAHDDGTHIFPSIASLAAKTRQSERAVQYQLRRMEQVGWLLLVNAGTGGRYGGAGKTREYRINPEWMKGAKVAPLAGSADVANKGANSAPLEPVKGANGDIKGCKSAQERVQNDARKGAKLLHPNQKQPSIKATISGATIKTRAIALDAELPDWLDREAWGHWVQHRQAIRKPLATDHAVSLQIRTLARLRDEGHDPRAVIDHAIENCWQGLYAPRAQGPDKRARASPGNKQQELEDRNRRVAAEWLSSEDDAVGDILEGGRAYADQ